MGQKKYQELRAKEVTCYFSYEIIFGKENKDGKQFILIKNLEGLLAIRGQKLSELGLAA